jgi:hypothetical protein
MLWFWSSFDGCISSSGDNSVIILDKNFKDYNSGKILAPALGRDPDLAIKSCNGNYTWLHPAKFLGFQILIGTGNDIP